MGSGRQLLNPLMRWMLALCLGLSLPPALLAEEADAAAVRRLDADYVRAYLDSDVARFRELLAGDFTCVLSDGRVLDKAGFLRMAAGPPRVDGFHTDQVVVRVYGETGIVTGRASYKRPDGGATVTRYVEVYVRREGRWRMVSAQFTRLAQ